MEVFQPGQVQGCRLQCTTGSRLRQRKSCFGLGLDKRTLLRESGAFHDLLLKTADSQHTLKIEIDLSLKVVPAPLRQLVGIAVGGKDRLWSFEGTAEIGLQGAGMRGSPNSASPTKEMEVWLTTSRLRLLEAELSNIPIFILELVVTSLAILRIVHMVATTTA